MPVQLEIPIFTADVEEFDVRSFERTGCRELVDLCREMNPAKDQRIRLELNAVDSYRKLFIILFWPSRGS